MDMDEKFLTLVRGIRDATCRGRLQWKKGETADVFFTEFSGEARVSIEQGHDANDDMYYNVNLINSSNEVIETLMIDWGIELKVAEELFLLARRNALGFDDVVDTLIDRVNLLNR